MEAQETTNGIIWTKKKKNFWGNSVGQATSVEATKQLTFWFKYLWLRKCCSTHSVPPAACFLRLNDWGTPLNHWTPFGLGWWRSQQPCDTLVFDQSSWHIGKPENKNSAENKTMIATFLEASIYVLQKWFVSVTIGVQSQWNHLLFIKLMALSY